MGLLKKLGLVEEINEESFEESDVYSTDDYVIEESQVNAELETVNVNSLIDDIYAQNDLSDKSRSIFKVEELIASLPKEMTTETKRNSVLSILGSFNLTATDVIADGDARVKVLASIWDKIEADSNSAIAEKEAKIEELKQTIETLNVEISSEKEKIKVSNEVIVAEVSKIEALTEFVGGVK